jgi:hypothetical protein
MAPESRSILALTAAEEGGDNNGVEWLIATHKPLIDAAYAINEGGGGTLTLAGSEVKPLFNSIQGGEKSPGEFHAHSQKLRWTLERAASRQCDLFSRQRACSYWPIHVSGRAESGVARIFRANRKSRAAGDGGSNARNRREPARLFGCCNSVTRSALRIDAENNMRRDTTLSEDTPTTRFLRQRQPM